MNRLLQIALILVRELFMTCAGKRIDWRRIFVAGALMTMAGIFLPNVIFICSPDVWYFPGSSWEDLNGTTVHMLEHANESRAVRLNGNVNRARHDRSNLVRVATDASMNVSAELVQLSTVVEGTPAVYKNSRAESRKNVDLLKNERKIRHPPPTAHRRRRRRLPPPVLPPPPPPPPLSRRDSILKRHLWSLHPNEAVIHAKEEVERAPVVSDDPDLYAPLFRNISVFKRSYELMEMMLQVYVYRDGQRPICHQPHLQGIYASEGWFMKHLEANKQFVTKDPEKAHLFYLPYSARQLEMALYVPDSHNMRPLSIFLKNYVNWIASKYPFWNRTHGSDHFLVACHDWGPYTVNEHEELRTNTIKALCNADLSEGVFVAGRDVSLPETTIRNPSKPLRNVGGKRVSQRTILAFYAGLMHGRVRPVLLKYWQDKDEDMKIYGPLPVRVSRKMSYVEHMKSSRYCICPMGYEVNSPRIVEAIYYECVPVIIADNFVPPLNEVLDWSAFSVIVAEKDIPKLKEILTAIPMRQYMRMQTNVKKLQKHFLWNLRPVRYDLFHMILHSIWFSRLNQQ
ncbi:hypothetical protein MLD38_038915 [Melastoma candidum]|uniref:Uncharacterized protein n=1 Tax=Melastoma candidum TaxID=119954 RepID=A0ACB9L0E5_9MYRT|nr:hypothetical protein MLD38_038915 [Melastoma candidum]